MLKLSLMALILLLSPPAWCQQQPAASDVRLQRSDRVKRLWGEIQVQRPEDLARITKEYSDKRLSEISATVREQVLETLNRGGGLDDIREAVKIVVGVVGPDSQPAAYAADLKGLKTVVIGFSVRYGSGGIPSGRAVLQGYRKAGLTYEFAGENGESLDTTSLILDELNSPRDNETWLLAHGQTRWIFGDLEETVLYSFDGYEFKELWKPGGRQNAEYKIAGDRFTITSSSITPERDASIITRDTVLLTSSGPVVTTDVQVLR